MRKKWKMFFDYIVKSIYIKIKNKNLYIVATVKVTNSHDYRGKTGYSICNDIESNRVVKG